MPGNMTEAVDVIGNTVEGSLSLVSSDWVMILLTCFFGFILFYMFFSFICAACNTTLTRLIKSLLKFFLDLFKWFGKSFLKFFKTLFIYLKGRRRCSGCKKRIFFVRKHREKFYCDKCAKRKFKICYYCDKCAKRKFKICYYCNKIIDGNIKTHKGHTCCPKCYKNHIKRCFHCRKSFELKNCIKYKGDFYCKKCHKIVYRTFHRIRIPFRKIPSETFEINPFKDYCGVEIECLNDNRDKNCFIKPELKKLHFSQLTDGSLNVSKGIEFDSRASQGDRLFKMFDDFGKELKDKKFYIKKCCGLHLHIETEPELDMLKKIYLFYSKYEDYFFDMLHKSRKNSGFCKRLRDTGDALGNVLDIKDINEFKKRFYESEYWRNEIKCHDNGKRYCWINFHSIFYRGTLEIRSHEGTIDSEEIKDWITLHLNVYEFLRKKTIRQIYNLKDSREEFLKILKKSKKYILERWEKHNPTKTQDFKDTKKA